MEQLIAKRYAVALFELSKECDKVDLFYDEVNIICTAIEENEEFEIILDHPTISGSEKFEMITKAFQGVSKEILGLIDIVIKKNRENELMAILQEFLTLVNEYKGIILACVYSAKTLTDTQIEKIKENLAKKLDKQIVMQTFIKPELIGGLLINVDGKVIDNSIKKNLQDIKQNLLNS